jgi:hypothetical protein
MPYKSEWTPAQKFMTYKGLNIYNTYKDNDFDQGPTTYYFSLQEDSDISDAFDVREFKCWHEGNRPHFLDKKENDTPKNRKAWDAWLEKGEDNHIKSIIRIAIDTGELVPMVAES